MWPVSPGEGTVRLSYTSVLTVGLAELCQWEVRLSHD